MFEIVFLVLHLGLRETAQWGLVARPCTLREAKFVFWACLDVLYATLFAGHGARKPCTTRDNFPLGNATLVACRCRLSREVHPVLVHSCIKPAPIVHVPCTERA